MHKGGINVRPKHFSYFSSNFKYDLHLKNNPFYGTFYCDILPNSHKRLRIFFLLLLTFPRPPSFLEIEVYPKTFTRLKTKIALLAQECSSSLDPKLSSHTSFHPFPNLISIDRKADSWSHRIHDLGHQRSQVLGHFQTTTWNP